MPQKSAGKARRATVVKVYGREYRIRSDEKEETVQRIARYVDEKMREMAQTAQSPDAVGVAVLTALNLAGEYLPRQNDRDDTAGMTSERIRKLIQIVDGSLAQTAPVRKSGRK